MQMNYKFLWLIGYVVAYSQEIVVRARRGDNYYTQHCVAFFLDIIPFTFHLGRITVSVCVCVHVSASTLLSNPLCLLP